MTRTLDDCFEGLPIRPMTKTLVENLILDRPLSPAQTVDFGVDSADHYRALQMMVSGSYEAEPVVDTDKASNSVFLDFRDLLVELDEALGNGAKLNALVQRHVPGYAKFVHFHTSWDVIFERGDEQAEED